MVEKEGVSLGWIDFTRDAKNKVDHIYLHFHREDIDISTPNSHTTILKLNGIVVTIETDPDMIHNRGNLIQ